MIPIRDDAPRYTTPYVNYFLIALNVLIFLFQQTLSPEQQNLFLGQFGSTPANITAWIGGNQHVGFLEASVPILTSTVFNLHSTNPTVGASGAIAGVMGAYFLLYPSARVLTLVPFFFVFLTWLPAWIFLIYWFVVQFLIGAASTITSSNQNTGGVAVWAHVGGFLAGLLLIKLFPARPQRFSYE